MAASERGCCVPRCGKTRKGDTILHSFPNPDKDMDRYLEWTSAVGITISSLDPQYVYRNRRVCHVHFETKFLTWTRRLSPDAVPTLFLPGVAATNVNQEAVSQPQILATHPVDSTNFDESLAQSDEVVISATSDTTETDPENENNTLSNLAAYWKSATGEEQHDDQPGSNHPALSDAADDAGSSDDDNIQEPPPPPQLNLHTSQMCRVCLALDVKMFDLRDTELKTMFQMTTGITFEEMEGSKLGSLICWECAARLQAASTFIRKALFSESLLKGLIKKGEQIPKQYFEKVKEEADSLIPPKTLTVTETVHIVEIEDQNIVTRLNKLGQLVQSRNDENDETKEIITYEIKEQIIDENSEMDVEGDKDVAIKTGIKDALDRSSIEGTVNFSRPLLDIGHTSLRSDLTSSKEDCDDLISKTVIKKYKNPKKLPKQNIELQNPIKRSIEALSHDREYYLKGDSEDGNKKKKIKKI